MKRYLLTFLIVASWCAVLGAQVSPPKIIDAHVHHNGAPEFLRRLASKMDQVDGMAVLLVERKDVDQVNAFVTQHPNRLAAFGSLDLDDPNALESVDRYRKMLNACGVSKESQANIFSGTMWRILNAK